MRHFASRKSWHKYRPVITEENIIRVWKRFYLNNTIFRAYSFTSFLTQHGDHVLENPGITWNFILVLEDPGIKP